MNRKSTMPRVGSAAVLSAISAVLACTGAAAGQCEMDKLLASDGQAEDRFGVDVSISGDTAIVGTYPADEVGAAYVYRFDGTTWAQEEILTAPDGQPGDRFGIAVAISGNWAIVGADGADDTGAVYAFRYEDNQWVLYQTLHASDGEAGDAFGHSVAVEGTALVVGAYRDDDNGTNSGSVYVFRRASLVFTQEAKIVPTDGAASDWFGWDCAVDDNFLIAGSYWDDDAGIAAGSACIYRFNGTDWVFKDKLIGADVAAWDHFGCSVGISGHVAVVGSSFDYDQAGGGSRVPGPGYAYVFRKDGAPWPEEAKLVPSDGALDDYFGSSVAIYGSTIIAGAREDDSNGVDSGSVYVFRYSDIAWAETAKLLAADGSMNDAFGNVVAFKSGRMIAGAINDDDNGQYAGSAHVFDLADNDCNHNGVCDTQDILSGGSDDCNENGVPDDCDVVEVLTFDSGPLTPIGAGSPQQFLITDPGQAAGDMRLFFTAIAELDGPSRYIAVELNGTQVGEVFVDVGMECADFPEEDHLIIDRDLFNQIVGGGENAQFTLIGMGGMDPTACGADNFIRVQIEHTIHGPNDANLNGIPDECECLGDINGDNAVDVVDLLALLAAWGNAGGPEDLNGDGVVDVVDLLVILSTWGPC